MRRWERWSFNVLAMATSTTGFAYLWMKYFVQSTDPFAVVNHPWQAPTLALHVVAAPIFILFFGIVFNSHIMKKLRATQLPNRRSGYASLATFFLMLASAYLLQVSSSERWLQTLVIVHIASGAVFTIVFVSHLIISASLARRRSSAILSEVA